MRLLLFALPLLLLVACGKPAEAPVAPEAPAVTRQAEPAPVTPLPPKKPSKPKAQKPKAPPPGWIPAPREEPALGYSCDAVRRFVRIMGRDAVLQAAREHGMSEAQIEAAKRCLVQ